MRIMCRPPGVSQRAQPRGDGQRLSSSYVPNVCKLHWTYEPTAFKGQGMLYTTHTHIHSVFKFKQLSAKEKDLLASLNELKTAQVIDTQDFWWI